MDADEPTAEAGTDSSEPATADRGPHGEGLDHGHGHGHIHGHGIEGGWSTWRSHRVLRLVLGSMILCALATLAGVWALWPDGAGQAEALAEARTLGLASERLSATVDSITEGPCSYQGTAEPMTCRTVTVLMGEGPDSGAIVVLPEFNLAQPGVQTNFGVGDQVIIGYEPDVDFYFFADRDRRTPLVWLTVGFAAVVIALGRLRGVLALSAMAITVVILVGFVAPSVLDGNDPLLVCLVAASSIAFVSLYLTHGFNPTTTVALAGTLGALLFTLAISSLVFAVARFSGVASEEGLTLPFVSGDLDLVGLLLGGAMIGALGALDDVTVTQVATVAELRQRSPELGRADLVTSGIRVGREHIASTVNTLLLAYAGASMPLLLLFALSDQSLGMIANSEVVALEIVRTLCGSIGLVAATPITTLLAAVVVASSPTGGRAPGPGLEPVSPARRFGRPGPATASVPTAAAGEAAGPEQGAGSGRAAPQWDDFAPRGDLEF